MGVISQTIQTKADELEILSEVCETMTKAGVCDGPDGPSCEACAVGRKMEKLKDRTRKVLGISG